MNNLTESKVYTTNKKAEQIERLQSHYTQPIEEIQEFLDDRKSAIAVTTGFEYLSVWYHWNFIQTFLKDGIVDYHVLSKATILGIESNNVRYFLGKKVETYKQAVSFEKAVKHLAQAVVMGWDDLAKKYGKILIEMLYGKQYKGWNGTHKHAWFMLEIFCKWQGIELNYSKLNYPKDMGVYKDVLDDCNTTDLSILERLVDKMSIFHIEQSDEDEYKDRTPDIHSADYFVFAIEIILFLNVRARLGLPEYEAKNDLMLLSINEWSIKKMDVPNIDILQLAKLKLKGNYPGIDFEF